MRKNSGGMWLTVFAGVLFTLALVVTLTPGGNIGVIHLNDAILASDLNSTNTETDNYVATYDAASGGFTWETAPISAHATTHENTGGDEIDLVDLSGLLADDQHVLDAEVISAVEAGTLSTVDIDGGTINGITDLAVVDGGTGAGSFTDHGVLLGTGTGALSVTSVGTTGQVLTGATGSDPVWAAPASGPTFLDKTADEVVNNSNTLQDDDDLTFSVLANKNYAVWGVLVHNAGPTPDIKFQWSVPAGATVEVMSDNGGFTEAAPLFIATGGTDVTTRFSGVVKVAGNAGTTVIQWAQNTATAEDTKMLEGTWMAHLQLN